MKTKYALFSIMALILGAIAGSIVWIVLKIITVLTELIWDVIPSSIFGSAEGIMLGQHSIIYNLVVCLIGAVLIGLFQRKNGILPDDTEQVIETIKENGAYPYDRPLVLSVAVIMPLIFGGALGVIFGAPLFGIVGNIEPDNRSEKYKEKILAAMYKLFNIATEKLAAKIAQHRVISCIIPAIAIAIMGY